MKSFFGYEMEQLYVSNILSLYNNTKNKRKNKKNASNYKLIKI